MNRLHALSAGAHAETGRFTGFVHSVFTRACNIELDDGRLVALLAPEHGNAPNAVRVDAPAQFAFDRVLRNGERAGCRAGVMRAGQIAVQVDRAPRWRAELESMRVDLREPTVHAAWRSARRELSRHPFATGSERSGVSREHTTALWRAARTLDVACAETVASELVGRGPGLTPAGDDILVGYLAGLRASVGASSGRTRFLDALGAAVRTAASRTNAISATYLLDATEGEVAERLAELVAAISRGASEAVVERTTAAALAVGATSGCDGVRGLLLGLAGFARGAVPMEPLP